MRKSLQNVAIATLLSVALMTIASCVSSDLVEVNKEAGYYYGFGSGADEKIAASVTMDDLIYNVLTESGSIKQERKSRVVITAEMREDFALLGLRPLVQEEKNDKIAIVYRISHADWLKADLARLQKLRAQLAPRYKAASTGTKTLQDRMVELGQIYSVITKAGATNSLTLEEASKQVFTKAIETYASSLVTGLVYTIKPSNGLFQDDTKVTITVTDQAGKMVVGLPLSFTWVLESETGEDTSSNAVVLTTDAKGAITLPALMDDNLRNKKLSLRSTGIFASKVSDSSVLVKIDQDLSKNFALRHFSDLKKIFSNEVRIGASDFVAGSVSQDRRAGGNEKQRKVKLKAFSIDRYPVTNSMYRAFLEATNAPDSDYPEFLENPDYNSSEQPVIGVSLEQAKKFAEWVSTIVGYTKRLPTEDEFEAGARGGQSVIFPWGDEAPTDGVRANYTGNGRFDFTSPVGSFENGKNSLGLFDMAGNVWHWTLTNPDSTMSADPSFVIVKGGSWMDGAFELRISNRNPRDPSQSYGDVGFRLVREANNE